MEVTHLTSKELVIAAQTLVLSLICLMEKGVVMELEAVQHQDALILLDHMGKELLQDCHHPLLKVVPYHLYRQGPLESIV